MRSRSAVQALEGAPRTGRAKRWRLSEEPDGPWTATAEVTVDKVRWTLRLSSAPGDAQVHLEATAGLDPDNRFIGEESVVWHVEGAEKVTALGRDYVWRRVEKRNVVGPWSPQVAQIRWASGAVLTVLGDAQSMVVSRDGQGGAALRFEGDNARNHPIRIFRDCWDSYASKQEKARDRVAAQRRGRPLRIRATLVLGDLDAVRPLRFPRRFRAALSFTDHADQSNAPKLEALMFGASGAKRGGAQRGFAGRGLGMTKSIFQGQRGSYAAQGGDPAYDGVLKRMRKAVGSDIEIGPHSVTGLEDTAEATRLAMEAMERHQPAGMPRVWIDHQPSTNCEALSNEGAGAREGSRPKFNVLGALRELGYTAAWAGFDQRSPRDGIDLFDPGRPGTYRPVLYSHTRIDDHENPLMLFSSLWRAVAYERFLEHYTDNRLEILSKQRGLHIAHTYLDTHVPGSKGLGKWTLLERDSDGAYRLKEGADGLFARLAARQDRKEIWVAGIGAIARHMAAMGQIRIRYLSDGGFSLTNEGDGPVISASFLLPNAPRFRGVTPVMSASGSDGELDLPHGMERDGFTFELSLPAGATKTVTLRDENGQRLSLLAPRSILLDRSAAGGRR